MILKIKANLESFEWDKGNLDKSYLKHGVSPKEAEEIFLNEQSLVIPDEKHSGIEERNIIIGQTLCGIYLFVVFTFRKKQIRIISARRMHKNEIKRYEKIKKNTSI